MENTKGHPVWKVAEDTERQGGQDWRGSGNALGGNDICSKPEEVRKDFEAARATRTNEKNSCGKGVPNKIFRFHEEKYPQSRTSWVMSLPLISLFCDLEEVTFSVPQYLISKIRIIEVPIL